MEASSLTSLYGPDGNPISLEVTVTSDEYDERDFSGAVLSRFSTEPEWKCEVSDQWGNIIERPKHVQIKQHADGTFEIHSENGLVGTGSTRGGPVTPPIHKPKPMKRVDGLLDALGDAAGKTSTEARRYIAENGMGDPWADALSDMAGHLSSIRAIVAKKRKDETLLPRDVEAAERTYEHMKRRIEAANEMLEESDG